MDIKQQELQKSKLVEKDEHINMIEVTEETRQAEVKQAKKEVVEEFKELHKILEKYRVKIPIKEMAEQSPYCIKFLQKLLKTIDASSEEDFISLSKECHVMFDVECWFTPPIYVEEHYIGEGLCDRSKCKPYESKSYCWTRELEEVSIP